jgi:O-antigen/teichoic acid export membrane protein
MDVGALTPSPRRFVSGPLSGEITNREAAGTQQFRSQVGHISRQSGIFFAGTVFTIALGYLFKIYIARKLGPADLGLYALGMTLIGLLGIFNTLGLPQSAVRFVAAYRSAGRFRELHSLLWRGAGLLVLANVVLAATLLVFGRAVAVRFYHAPALVPYLPLFALLMLFGVLSGFYGKVLAGYRDLTQRTIIQNFVGSPLNMGVAVILISAGLGLRGYLLAQVLSGAIVCTLLMAAVRRFTPAPARFLAQPGAPPKREIWTFSASMVGIGFLEFAMTQVDKIALGFYRSARDVGIYSVAAALVVYVPLVLSSVNQIFAPTIADLHARGEHALLARLFQSLTKWVIGLTLPLATVVILFSRPLMRVFGHDFEAGWPILVIGTLGQLVNCGVGSVGYLLLMSGHEKRLIKVQVAMSAVMIVLSAALVPLWGIVGAALAAAVTNVGMNALNLFEVRSALGISPYNRGYFRLVPPALAMLTATLVLKMNSERFHHDWLAAGVALVFTYAVFGAAVLMMGLDADDRTIASAIWSRVRGMLVSLPAGGS